MTRDNMSKLVGVVAVLIVGSAMSVMACGGDAKKPPLTPDTTAPVSTDDAAEAGAPAAPATPDPSAAPAAPTP